MSGHPELVIQPQTQKGTRGASDEIKPLVSAPQAQNVCCPWNHLMPPACSTQVPTSRKLTSSDAQASTPSAHTSAQTHESSPVPLPVSGPSGLATHLAGTNRAYQRVCPFDWRDGDAGVDGCGPTGRLVQAGRVRRLPTHSIHTESQAPKALSSSVSRNSLHIFSWSLTGALPIHIQPLQPVNYQE